MLIPSANCLFTSISMHVWFRLSLYMQMMQLWKTRFFLDGFPYDTDAADGTSGVHKRQSQAVSCLNCGTFIPCDTTSSNRLDLNSNVPPTRFLPWDYFGGLWHHLGTFHNVMGSLEASFKLVITQTAFRLPQGLIWEDGQFQICSDFHFFRF